MFYFEWFSRNPYKAHCYTVDEIELRSEQLNAKLAKVVAELAALEKSIKERQRVSLSELSRVSRLEKQLDVLYHQTKVLQKLMQGTVAIKA